MRIDMIDLRKSDDRKIFNKLQPIINENLVANEGTLRQANILNEDYDWTHLFIVKDEERIIGFAILRYSDYDQHYTGFNDYYYISNIVLLKKYQNKRIGTELLQRVLKDVTDLPVVASVREDNQISYKLFVKNMDVYLKKGKYYRFMDVNSYKLRDGSISSNFRL